MRPVARVLFLVVVILAVAFVPAIPARSVDESRALPLDSPSVPLATTGLNCGTSQTFDAANSYPGATGPSNYPGIVDGTAFAPVTKLHAQFLNNAAFCGATSNGCDMNYEKVFPYQGTFPLAWYCSWDANGNLFIEANVNELASGFYQVNAWVQEQETQQSYGSWVMQVVHCTMNQLSYAGGSQSGTHLRATFTGGSPECPAASTTMSVDGVAVAATVTKSGTTYTFDYDSPNPFGGGHHTVSASVTETCCRPDGSINQATGGFSFDIQNCGANPLQLVDYSPKGTAVQSNVIIEARFRDLDVRCPLTSATMTLNGQAVTPSVAAVGNEWVVSYQTAVLPAQPYTVQVRLKEACCTPAGAENEGTASWGFAHLSVTPGPDQTFDAYLPGGTTSVDNDATGTHASVGNEPVHIWYGLFLLSTSPTRDDYAHVATSVSVSVSAAGNHADQTIPLLV